MTSLNLQSKEKQKKRIRPVFDRMLLEPVDLLAAGGLSVPSSIANQTICLCKVLAIGPGKLIADTNSHLQMNVRPGDMVYINQLLGNKIRVPQNMYQLVVELPDGGGEVVLEPGKEYILQNEDTIYAKLD